MVGCQLTDKAAVHFFREWALWIARPQARLHMANRNIVGKPGKSARQRCSCIALNDYYVREFFVPGSGSAPTGRARKPCRALVGSHDLEIVINPNPEEIREGIQ